MMDLGIKKNGIEINIVNISVLVVLTLVIIQAIGLIFDNFIEINLGPVFIMLIVGISSLMGIAIFRNSMDGSDVSKKDIFAMIVVSLVAFLVLFFMRDFVPEIFEQGIVQLQAMVGF